MKLIIEDNEGTETKYRIGCFHQWTNFKSIHFIEKGNTEHTDIAENKFASLHLFDGD